MALLGMIQKVTARIGISTPTNVIGNSDSQVAQLLALAQEEGEDLRARFQWSALVRNNTFTITLAASQGALNGTVISDGDYDYITDQTMWNRTTSLPIIGPLNSDHIKHFKHSLLPAHINNGCCAARISFSILSNICRYSGFWLLFNQFCESSVVLLTSVGC